MTVRPTRHSRLFRALVRLLPFDFRFDYGGEMEQVFREQRLDAARERGRAGVFGLWLGLARDIAITAPREHASDIGRDVRYALRGLRRSPGFAASHTFLPVLAVKPLAGRGFNEEDDRANGPKVALISEALWTRSFARDPGVVGRTVLLDEVPHLVVGVVPARADFGVLLYVYGLITGRRRRSWFRRVGR